MKTDEGLTGAQWCKLREWMVKHREFLGRCNSWNDVYEHATRTDMQINKIAADNEEWAEKYVRGARVAGLEFEHVKTMAGMIGLRLRP